MLLVPVNETSHQPTPIAELRALVPNKTILSVSPAAEAPNQPLFAVQLEIPALLQQDLAIVPRILPVPVLSKSLIIQNAVRERPRRRGKDCPRRSRGQR